MTILNDKEIPTGLGMALSQNIDALNAFTALDEAARTQVLARSRRATSKKDMASIVNDLLGGV